MQGVSKISKENLTKSADWIKEAAQSEMSLVLMRGNWENVVPGRARRGYGKWGEAGITLVLISLNLKCVVGD